MEKDIQDLWKYMQCTFLYAFTCLYKWLSEEALQIAVKQGEVKSKGEKERYSHLNCRVPKNSKER